MTTKARKLLALTLLAVIAGVIAYSLLRESDEPKYEGRPLSEWLEQYSEHPSETVAGFQRRNDMSHEYAGDSSLLRGSICGNIARGSCNSGT